MIVYGMIALVMAAAALQDIKSKKIHKAILVVIGILCVTGCFIGEKTDWWNMAGGMTVGLCMIGLSMLSGEQIGMGDGIVIGLIGLLLGARRCLVMLCIASCIMAAISIVVLIIKKGNRHTRLPFIPALCGGYLAVLVVMP